MHDCTKFGIGVRLTLIALLLASAVAFIPLPCVACPTGCMYGWTPEVQELEISGYCCMTDCGINSCHAWASICLGEGPGYCNKLDMSLTDIHHPWPLRSRFTSPSARRIAVCSDTGTAYLTMHATLQDWDVLACDSTCRDCSACGDCGTKQDGLDFGGWGYEGRQLESGESFNGSDDEEFDPRLYRNATLSVNQPGIYVVKAQVDDVGDQIISGRTFPEWGSGTGDYPGTRDDPGFALSLTFDVRLWPVESCPAPGASPTPVDGSSGCGTGGCGGGGAWDWPLTPATARPG